MSMSGLYKAPERANQLWKGTERRSRDPVNQLARSLDQLCLNAADSYEIAAHLEALGYNNAEILAKYGLQSHFELAEKLYALTPRRPALERPIKKRQQDYLQPIVVVLTLVVTLAVGLVAVVQAWAPVFWLLIWSQGGSALFSRAKGELEAQNHQAVLTDLLKIGLIGVAVVWLVAPFGLQALVVTLIWLSVAGLLWGGQTKRALALPFATAALLGLHVWLGLELVVMLVAVAGISLLLLYPPRLLSRFQSWSWLTSQFGFVFPYLLYGFGQACLLMALVSTGSLESLVLPGLILFVVILLTSEKLLLLFQRKLAQHLWNETSERQYEVKAQRVILGYVCLYLLPLVPASLIWLYLGQQPWLFHWFGFALFGLALGLALVSLSVGNVVVPSTIFFTAGLISLGTPFFMVAVPMVALQLITLLKQARQVGKYGIYLL